MHKKAVEILISYVYNENNIGQRPAFVIEKTWKGRVIYAEAWCQYSLIQTVFC